MIKKKTVSLIEVSSPTLKTILQVQIIDRKKSFIMISLTDLKQQLNNL
jgi:hypothetical protein